MRPSAKPFKSNSSLYLQSGRKVNVASLSEVITFIVKCRPNTWLWLYCVTFSNLEIDKYLWDMQYTQLYTQHTFSMLYKAAWLTTPICVQ